MTRARSGRVAALILALLVACLGMLGSGAAPVSATGGDSLSVVTTVGVGSTPWGVAVSPDGSRVYVANYGDSSVSVINTATNTVVTTVSVGSYPWDLAMSPDGSRVYVVNYYADSVSVIATATNAVVATVGVGSYPQAVAVSPDGSRVYVANYGGDSVSVINTATNAVVATVSVGRRPSGVAVSPDGSRVYVPIEDSKVKVINTATNAVVATVGVGSSPYGVAVSPDGSRVYVSNYYDDSVSVINTATNAVVATVGVGSYPYGVAVGPGGSPVYVTNSEAASVSVLGASASAPAAPTSLNVTPGSGSASVSFTAGADGGASISNYEYQLNGAGSWVALSPADTSSPVTIPGLTNGTAYTVKLRAVNTAGSGAASDASGSFTPRTVPGAPTISSVTAGDSTVSVAFTAGSTGGSSITGYEYQLNGSGSWFSLGTTSSPVAIPGLTNGTSYTVKLRAVNVAGSGAASDASGSFTPATTPDAPTSIDVESDDGSALISFTAGADGGAAISKYEFSIDGGSTWADAVGTASPVTIPGLTNGSSYSIKLRAVNTVGAGTASSAVSVDPAPAGPTTCPMSALGKYSIQTCWNPLVPVQGKTNRYRAYVYIAGTTTRVASCKGSAADTGCVVKGGGKLTAATDYDVRVRARVQIAPRQVIWSLYSAPVRVSTLP